METYELFLHSSKPCRTPLPVPLPLSTQWLESMCGYFSAGANPKLQGCDIFGCLFFKAARIRKTENNNDDLSPLHTAFFVDDSR